MLASQGKIKGNVQSWNVKKRYRVGNVVDYLGEKYQNSTGVNTQPDLLLDWIKIAVILPTKTSDLINDGEDGNRFISLLDLPSNLILYPTNVASDISGYSKMVTDIHDPEYNSTAVDVSTGAITTTDQLVASLATVSNLIIGNPGVFNITTIGNITRTSGSGTASFYFKAFKRDSGGTETLVATSSTTVPVIDTGYVEFNTTGLWDDGIFTSTDRIVLKFYANRIAGGSNPTFTFQFGGSTPVRSLVPIPLSVVPVADPANLISTDADNTIVLGADGKLYSAGGSFLKKVFTNTVATSAVTGTLSETIIYSVPVIPGGTFNTSDFLGIILAFYKPGAISITLRIRASNTNDVLTAPIIASVIFIGQRTLISRRNFHFKADNTITGFTTAASSLTDDSWSNNFPLSSTALNPANNIFIFITVQLANISESVTMTSIKITN